MSRDAGRGTVGASVEECVVLMVFVSGRLLWNL